MTKIIIIFGIILVLFAWFVFYQFATPSQSEIKKVNLNGKTFAAEVVKSDKDQQIGLTKYDSLPADKGMLFQFTTDTNHTFWMRGMQFPIDIIFIRDNAIVGIVENASPAKPSDKQTITYGDNLTSDTVLEINAGLVKKHNIKKGDKVKIE